MAVVFQIPQHLNPIKRDTLDKRVQSMDTPNNVHDLKDWLLTFWYQNPRHIFPGQLVTSESYFRKSRTNILMLNLQESIGLMFFFFFVSISNFLSSLSASDPSELPPWPWFRLCPCLLSPTPPATVEELADDTSLALHPPSTCLHPSWIQWAQAVASSPHVPIPTRTIALLQSWGAEVGGQRQGLPA